MCAAWLLHAPLQAQGPPFFRHFSPAQGLADRTVNQVLEDAQGFIWVATNDGLNRFDGREWLTFRHRSGEPHGIAGNRITALANAPDGSLWIGTADGGLCQWHPQRARFQRHRIPLGAAPPHILAVHADADGSILASVEKAGVFRKAVDRQSFERDPGFTRASHNRVLAFVATEQGTLASCMGLGLVRHHTDGALPLSDTAAAYPWPGQVIAALHADANGRIWMGAWDNGLHRYDPRSGVAMMATLDHRPFSASEEEITAITRAPRGFWLGTKSSGLYQLDTASMRFTRHQHRFIDRTSLASNAIRCLHTDSRGTVWIGTDNGLDCIDPQAQHFDILWMGGSIEAADLGDPITGITAGQGGLLVASARGLWRDADRSLTRRAIRDEQAGMHYHAVHSSQDGMLLVGTNRSLHLLTNDERLQPMRGFHIVTRGPGIGAPDPFNIQSSRITSIAEAVWQGRPVWIASVIGHGILVVNPRTRVGLMEHVLMPEGPFENMFSGSLTDRRGRLWLMGRNTGLSMGLTVVEAERAERAMRDAAGCKGVCPEPDYFRLGVERHFNGADAPRIITGMVELPDGTFHVATEDRGLLRFDPDKAEPFTSEASPNNRIEGIARDALGRTWCVAAGGFDVLDPARGAWLRIDPADGLPEKGVRGTLHALPSGAFAVGSFGGIVRFDPSAIRFQGTAPAIRLTHLRIFDQPADSLLAGAPIRFHHTQNFISIAFTSFAYGALDDHRYHWQLIGVDPEPVDGGARTTASYTNLRGGDYRFRAWAVNSAGIASDPVELAITIVPPFWERGWFFALIAAFLGALAYAAYRYRIAQLQRMQQLRLTAAIEAQEKERKRIARDLHDDLGTRISTLKLYMGGLRNYLMDGEEAREVERSATELLDESVRDLRAMLHDLSPDTVARYGYVKAVEELMLRIDKSRVVRAAMQVTGPPLRLGPERELALYRVTQELINNSLKHSGCSRIDLRVLHHEGRVEILYEDDGRGMDLQRPSEGHGLSNIRSRLQLIGGGITWDSAPGKGLRALIQLTA